MLEMVDSSRVLLASYSLATAAVSSCNAPVVSSCTAMSSSLAAAAVICWLMFSF